MAKLEVRPRIDLEIVFSVNEAEARALDALVGYGADAFIKAFYEKLGESYMRDHEAGLRSFLKSITPFISAALHRQDMAEKAFSGRYDLVEKKAATQ